MSYTVSQIKVCAYNREVKPDFTVAERNLYIGLEYCYDWFRQHPEDKYNAEKLMQDYINHYLYLKELEGK